MALESPKYPLITDVLGDILGLHSLFGNCW